MPVWKKKKIISRKEAKAGKVIRLGCKSDPPVKERRWRRPRQSCSLREVLSLLLQIILRLGCLASQPTASQWQQPRKDEGLCGLSETSMVTPR